MDASSTRTLEDQAIKEEKSTCTTSDGHTIALWRYSPRKEKTERTHPVVLLHGLASNRFTYDLNPNVSIAKHMASKGWDTWIVELRGSGDSKSANNNRATDTSWVFEHHVEDVRVALKEIFTQTNKEIHLIGHSMGAMLLQRTATGPSRDIIRSGVSIAGTFVMENSRWKEFLWLWPIVENFDTIHTEYVQKILAPMSFRFNTVWDELFFCTDNVDPNVARHMFAVNWEPVSTRLLSQIQTAFTANGLRSQPNNKIYKDTLTKIQTPMLCIAGSKDEQCTATDMKKASTLMPTSIFKCMGKEFGQKHDYGHFDLIVGRDAKTEVWGPIIEFLTKNDHPSQPGRY
jgi:pimeloyl-ACP methyl ester carboxylesterase